ncbi:MAG: hypothetical protein EX270_13245 [Pseudomonadales bacterium]|nr:MAG: hypothetical protein EX270_13245 [Pseudomonadales bacterium]
MKLVGNWPEGSQALVDELIEIMLAGDCFIHPAIELIFDDDGVCIGGDIERGVVSLQILNEFAIPVGWFKDSGVRAVSNYTKRQLRAAQIMFDLWGKTNRIENESAEGSKADIRSFIRRRMYVSGVIHPLAEYANHDANSRPAKYQNGELTVYGTHALYGNAGRLGL